MGVQRKAPQCRNRTTLRSLLDMDSGDDAGAEAEKLRAIISHCTVVFTFTDPGESPSEQDAKTRKLDRLLSIVKSSGDPLQAPVLGPLFSMLAANLFRPLPPPPSAEPSEDEELLSFHCPAWPHLAIVYEILDHLVRTLPPDSLRHVVDHPFLTGLLALFQSEDRRERETLKALFHVIYIRLVSHRRFMRKSMTDAFLHFGFETEKQSGIAELLEIWGSIINGFIVPLKEEHRVFLTRVLMPLHKPKCVQAYHTQLAYCVLQFVKKEPRLGGTVVKGILRYWPNTNSQKEVLFIEEVEEVVEQLAEVADSAEIAAIAVPVCLRIARCLSSWNFQVAERALFVWNSEPFVKMATLATAEVFPAIVEGLEKNINWHWNKSIRQLSRDVKTMLESMEPQQYSMCLQPCLQEICSTGESSAVQEEEKRKKMWEMLEMAAASHSQYPLNGACSTGLDSCKAS